MLAKIISESISAFHQNAVNNLAYNFTTNWWLIIIVAAAIASVIMGVKEQSGSVVHEEQNIL